MTSHEQRELRRDSYIDSSTARYGNLILEDQDHSQAIKMPANKSSLREGLQPEASSAGTRIMDSTGRSYIGYVDKYGREVRDYEVVREYSSTHPSFREFPRSEHRTEPSRRSTAGTTTSTKYSTRDRSRRESESLSKRPELDTGYGGRSDPIPIQAGSSVRSNDRGGYSRSRDDGAYEESSRQDIPVSSSLHASRSHRASTSYHSPATNDWASSQDPKTEPMTSLTMHDVLGSPQYSLAGVTRDPHPGVYDDNRWQLQPQSPTLANQDVHVGSVRDKGKEIETAQHPEQPESKFQTHIIRGTPGDTEKLDKSYTKRNHDYLKFFRPGRVFSTLWTDSYDDSHHSENEQFMSKVTYVIYNQNMSFKIRRFVVITQGTGYCTCLPVTTYNGRGHKKRDINLDDHGLIYSSSKPPPYVDGIRNEPLKVNLSKGAEKLANPSYINYGSVYTVEMNIKVKDVGDLDTKSRKLLRFNYNKIRFRDFSKDEGNADPSGFTARDQYSSGPPIDSRQPWEDTSSPSTSRREPIYEDDTQITIPSLDEAMACHRRERVIVRSSDGRGRGRDRDRDRDTNLEHGAAVRDSVSHQLSSERSLEETNHTRIDHQDLAGPKGDSISQTSPNVDSVGNEAQASLSIPPVAPLSPSPCYQADDNETPTRSEAILKSSKDSISHSRSSSVDTIESLVFSVMSVSSCSSLATEEDGAERLVALLLKDEQLQCLYREAAKKVSLDKFEDNFRRCLLQCSAHLKAEVKSLNGRQCARAIRRYSRTAANCVRSTLETEAAGVRAEDHDANSDNDDLEITPRQRGEDENDSSDGEDWEDEQSLELTLTTSAAYRLLKENLSLFLHPDPVKRALFKTWPVSHQRSLPLEIKYDVRWELISFIQTCFAPGQMLEDVMTISGGSLNAQAQSCRFYITSNWPEFGEILLDGVQNLVLGGLAVTKQNEHVRFSLDVLGTTDQTSHVTASMTSTHELQEKFASALSWLASALRPSSHSNTVYSSTKIEATQDAPGKRRIKVQLKDLEEISGEKYCWHSLFPYAVIAKGFPISLRPEGKGRGLEISCVDMILLSQSLNFLEYDGGLVAEGLRSFLIPTILLPDGSVQWHFEYKRQPKSRGGRTRLSEIFKRNPLLPRYKMLDPIKLIEQRCFLGWAEEVAVTMGTEEFSTAKIRWSGAAISKGTGHLKSHSITTGTEGLSIFGLTVTRTYLPIAIPNRMTSQGSKDILSTLDDDFDANILLYDTGAKTAWLLPQASAVLFLAHRIANRREYQLFDNGQPTSLQFASAQAESQPLESISILRNCLEFKMKKGGKFVDGSFGRIIKEIWNKLDEISDKLVSAEREYKTVGRCAPKFLHGFEFEEVTRLKNSMDIKQAKVDQAWAALMFSGPPVPVLFCKGLGQPIVPGSPELLCKTWTKVPAGRDFMATTGMSLYPFLDRHDGDEGSRLGVTVEWNRAKQGSLIRTHTHRSPHQVIRHEQYLRHVKNANFDMQIVNMVKNCERSGFVFGSSLRLQMGCSGRPIGIPCSSKRPISRTSLICLQKVPDTPEGSSDTSSETGSSFNLEESAGASLTSSDGIQDLQGIRMQPYPCLGGPSSTERVQRASEYHFKYGPEARNCDEQESSRSTPRSLRRMKGLVGLKGSIGQQTSAVTNAQLRSSHADSEEN